MARFTVFGVLVGVVLSVGCARANALPADVKKVLEDAKEVVLLSLDPERGPAAAKEGKQFHGWKVLGQTALTKDDKDKALKAVFKGIADSDGLVAGCFIPRHGLRATHGGKTVEVVICFQCLSMQAYVDGKRSGGALTTRTPQPTLDAILKAAKVPLPKAAE